MYQDPKRIRNTRVSINLDDYEAALIQALVDYTGTQRATLIRQMVIAQAEAALIPSPKRITSPSATSEAQTGGV